MSSPREVGAVVGQGTMGGALVSQAVLDTGIQQEFHPGGEEEMQYGSVPLAPLLFQDDVLHGVEGLEQARSGNLKLNKILKQRALKLNSKKSVCLMIGSKKQKEQFSKELKEKPLMCGQVETRETDVDKWLGQKISSVLLIIKVK